jgi:hypothetical protein
MVCAEKTLDFFPEVGFEFKIRGSPPGRRNLLEPRMHEAADAADVTRTQEGTAVG